MKIKTSEATELQLNWLVAKCEGFIKVSMWSDHIGVCKKHSFEDERRWAPSTNWAQGGPIIEREGICHASIRQGRRIVGWRAAYIHDGVFGFDSPTPLIAAMRCYVASKLGEEVEVPDELQ